MFTAGNARKGWTEEEDALLAAMAAGDVPPRLIALRLGRTLSAIEQRAFSRGVALKSPKKTQLAHHNAWAMQPDGKQGEDLSRLKP